MKTKTVEASKSKKCQEGRNVGKLIASEFNSRTIYLKISYELGDHESLSKSHLCSDRNRKCQRLFCGGGRVVWCLCVGVGRGERERDDRENTICVGTISYFLQCLVKFKTNWNGVATLRSFFMW